ISWLHPQVDQLSEAGEEARYCGESPGEEQHTDDDKEATGHAFDWNEPAAHALGPGQEPVEGDRRDEEWDAESERVDGEECHASYHRRLDARIEEDRGEDRPDARRPAGTEGEAGDDGS